MKTCEHCFIEKPFSDFYENKNSAGGFESKCKNCRKLLMELSKEEKENLDIITVIPKRGKKYTDKELLIVNSSDFNFKCSICKEIKPNKDFYKLRRKDTKRSRNFTARCKACRDIEKFKKYNSSEKRRKYMIKREFDLEYSDYLELHKIQNSSCAICGIMESELTGRTKRLAVDHCHDTNKVRGLLCGRCNTSIGKLEDSPELLRKAADYIEFHKERHERIIMEEKQNLEVAVPLTELISTP